MLAPAREGVSSLGYNSSLILFDSYPGGWAELSFDFDADIIVASYLYGCSDISAHQLEVDMVHDNGTIMIAAAGNGTLSASGHCDSPDGKNNGDVYPASYNHVISVGGSTPDDYYYDTNSNHLTFNSKVDLIAPGWEVPAASRNFSTNLNDTYLPNWNGYTSFKGTSAAAPIVGGLASLILALNSDLTPRQVENIMKKTSINIDYLLRLDGKPQNSTFAGLAGAGRIDAFEAVKLTQQCFTNNFLLTSNYPQDYGFNPPKTITKRAIKVAGITLQQNSNYEFYVDRNIIFEPNFKVPLGTTMKVDISIDCKSVN